MQIVPLSLPEVLRIEPKVFGDDRGFFFESFNARSFNNATGLNLEFVQDNHSKSARHVLRGLHYQLIKQQAKLVRCVQGEIFDVAVDLRRNSANFGKWAAAVLSAENKHQLFVPEGFAHGFVVLSDVAEVLYKTNDYWYPEYERALFWQDPDVAIKWPDGLSPILSEKDQQAQALSQAETYP